MTTTVQYVPHSVTTRTQNGTGIARRDLDIICSLVPEGASVLDLGCGDGGLLVRLMAEKRALARGIEISDLQVRTCIARGLTVRHGNLDEGLADYPDDSFDVVILSNTLPYLDQPRRVLLEMLRVGRSGIASFANMGYYRNRIAASLGRGIRGCELADGPRARPISLQAFRAFCGDLGLRVVRESHSAPLLPDLLADFGIFVVGRGTREE